MSTPAVLGDSGVGANAAAPARILCVDDEPHVLEGLALHLRKRYHVSKATSGAAGLQALEQDPSICVVISDMRMPSMDGATFLSKTRRIVPDAIRLLLTGQAQMQSAIAAVNEGQIFRFLTKPCPPATLIGAIDAAVEQHRLITSERVLLEQTVHGCIKALTDALALINPQLFGRASRAKQYVSELATKLEMPARWQLEVAAMLSQLGGIALPVETVDKVHRGQPLTSDEQQMVARVPAITEQLVGSIPRLEVVRAILALYPTVRRGQAVDPADPSSALIARGAQILRVVLDFDALEAQGHTPGQALDALRARADWYDPSILDALHATRGLLMDGDQIREMPLADLHIGMVLLDDVKGDTGIILAPRGYEVTSGFVERARNFRQSERMEPVRVIVPGLARRRRGA